MANYGGYNRGGYGQSNPYDQRGNQQYAQDGGNPYAQSAGNPYSQQAPQGGYGDGYGDDVEMAPLNGGQGSYGQPARADPMAILNECRDIDRGIDAIERNLERLRSLQQRALDDPDASQGTQTNRELDALNSDTMTLYRNFTDRLRKIKSNPESGNAQNKSQVGRVDRKLKDAINKYQNVDADFRQKLQAQMARQYRIVRPDASDAEVREACEDTTQTQLFSQALLQSDRRGQSQSALRAVQGRHEAIQKIERQVEELARLFQDVDALVVQQEPVVDVIDQRAEETQQNVVHGSGALDNAIKSAKNRNKWKWYCLLIVVIIIIIVVVVVVVVVEINKNKTPTTKMLRSM